MALSFDEDKTSNPKINKLEIATRLTTVIAPLMLLVALAADVGTFYAIDIAYFTFFTLSEHTIFTLEYLPFAFVDAFLVTVGLLLAIIFLEKRYSKRNIVLFIIGLYYCTFMASGLFVSFKLNTIVIGSGLILLAFGGVVVPVYIIAIMNRIDLISGRMFFDVDLSSLISVTFAFVIVIIMSFFYGVFNGAKFISHNGKRNIIFTKDIGIISGRVIRGGSSGVLLYDGDKKEVLFLKWDSIQKVASPEKIE